MARLTIHQYIAKLEKQKRALGQTKATFTAASTAHADMVERIFTDGNASNGGKIGQYDNSDPIYVNPDDSPRGVTPKGKNGQSTFKNGKPHKTSYFGSYKAFRQAVSRPTSYVNLDLFGRLKQEFENSISRISDTSFEARIRTSENQDKAIGNQRRFGKVIFGAAEAERDTFRDVLRFEINRIINA